MKRDASGNPSSLIGNLIRRLRDISNKNRVELAGVLGIKPFQLAQVEHGDFSKITRSGVLQIIRGVISNGLKKDKCRILKLFSEVFPKRRRKRIKFDSKKVRRTKTGKARR
jgi:hypothetical protein